MKKQVNADWRHSHRNTDRQTDCGTDSLYNRRQMSQWDKIRGDDAELIKIPHLKAVQCSAFMVIVTSDPFSEESEESGSDEIYP